MKLRGSIAFGGSAQIGPDTNLYRQSANVLKTDDALTVAGTLTASGASTLTGAVAAQGTVTASAKVDASGATALLVPYATASPTVDANGHFTFLQKSNRSYMLYQAGGTPCYITLPQVTAGTMLVTVGGTP